ncbi:hypothetical protein RRG08_002898, partial [Elysia crispata]
AGEDPSQLEGAIAMLVAIEKSVVNDKLLGCLEGLEGDVTQLYGLIRHDDFITWDGDTSATTKGKERHVFLFADKIVMTRKRKPDSSSDRATFAFKSAMELRSVSYPKRPSTSGRCSSIDRSVQVLTSVLSPLPSISRASIAPQRELPQASINLRAMFQH